MTGDDPKALLDKVVHWSAHAIGMPDGECVVHDASVQLMDNVLLENGIWGGQRIGELSLTKTDRAKAFGRRQTFVFQDQIGCGNAVLIDHNHMVDAFGSGWIYRLDRVGG